MVFAEDHMSVEGLTPILNVSNLEGS